MQMRFVLTLAASVALAACGGSGNDDDRDQGSSSGAQDTLTKANYVPVAQATLATNAYLLDTSRLFLGGGVRGAALEQFTQLRASQLTLGPLDPHSIVDARLPEYVPPPAPLGLPEMSEERCDDGGHVVMEYTDANKNRRSDRGDFVVFSAKNCVFGGSVLNGQVTLTLESVSGQTNIYPNSLIATAVYNNLSSTAAGVTTIGNGSMTFSASEQGAVSQDAKLHAQTFSVTRVSGATATTQDLKNYDVTLNVRPHPLYQVYVSSANGTLTDSTFVYQPLTVKTTQPFVRLGNQRYADQGEILITDGFRGKVRARVTSATAVAIDLDEDGNGSYETGVNKLWSDIL